MANYVSFRLNAEDSYELTMAANKTDKITLSFDDGNFYFNCYHAEEIFDLLSIVDYKKIEIINNEDVELGEPIDLWLSN